MYFFSFTHKPLWVQLETCCVYILETCYITCRVYIVFSRIAALEHNVDICSLFVGRKPISFANKFIDFAFSISLFEILNLSLASVASLLNIIAYNLPGLTITLLFLSKSAVGYGSRSSNILIRFPCLIKFLKAAKGSLSFISDGTVYHILDQ